MTDEFSLATSHVLIAGLGVTGRAVADALQGRVARLTTVDVSGEGDISDPQSVDLADIDVIVASPGWPPSHELLIRASRQGIPVISEVELAWQLREPTERTGAPAPWLAVTGTNGKTTTAQILGSILSAAGVPHHVVGNIGQPLVTAVLDAAAEVLVVELSSFQLHFTYSVRAHAAAILNIAEDHLDWHGSFAAYAAAKAKIYHGAHTACVYPVGDDRITAMVADADVTEGARAVGCTTGAPEPGQIGLVGSIVVDRAFHTDIADPVRHRHADEVATLGDLGHLGTSEGAIPNHVLSNALVATALARSVGVSATNVADGLRTFHPGGHRIDTVAQLDEVTYVDDSKATNPHAARASIGAQQDNTVVWIAGGLTKGVSFDELVAAALPKLRAVVLIGADQRDLQGALDRHAPHIPISVIDPSDTRTVMHRAVAAARAYARPGDVVLLAPACASMDQFRSYAERGDSFAAAARSLVGVDRSE